MVHASIYRIWTAALWGLLLLAMVTAPSHAETEPEAGRRFENRDFGVAFEYPVSWTAVAGEARQLVAPSSFAVRASADPTTAFVVAIYPLEPAVDESELDAALDVQDSLFLSWVQQQPGGRVIAIYDVTVDDRDGREYTYRFLQGDQTLLASTILVPHGNRAIEISQWARETEYQARGAQFDGIFASLLLPW